MLTEMRVHELAAQLAESGQPVTLVRIREANGHSGSLSTISRYLATWREGRSATAEAEARRDPAIDALERLAPGTYARVVARVGEQHRGTFADLRAELEAMRIDRGALVAALASSEARVDEVTRQASTAQSERTAVIEALATVTAVSVDVQALTALVTAQAESALATRALLIAAVEKSQAQMSEAQQEMELQMANFGEQVVDGVARITEQLTATLAEVNSTSGQERELLRAELSAQVASLNASVNSQMITMSAAQRSSQRTLRQSLLDMLRPCPQSESRQGFIRQSRGRFTS